MKKFLLLFVSTVFAVGGLQAQSWNLVKSSEKGIKMIPEANFAKKVQKVDFESMNAYQGFTREGEEEIDYLKVMSYMPGDQEGAYTMAFHKVLNGFPQTGTMAVGTVYDYRMVNSFAGNTIAEIYTWIGPGMSNIKYTIWDANTQEVLWSKSGGLTSGGEKGKSVSTVCDYLIEKDRPIIVGYQFSFKGGQVVLPIFDTAVPTMGFVVDMTQLGATEGFADLTSYLTCTFYVECLTEGEKSHPINDVSFQNLNASRAKAGKSYQPTATFVNYGKAPVKKLEYTYFDGEKDVVQTITSETGIPYLGKSTFPVSAEAPATGGKYDVNLAVNKINDAEDGFAGFSITDEEGKTYNVEDNKVGTTLLSVTNSAHRKVVLEEFTGQWCGWCSAGIVAMDKVEKLFPNDAAVICVHVGDQNAIDEMTDLSYADLSFSVPGYPSLLINRYALADPYYGTTGYGIEKDIEVMRYMACEATMGVASELSDDGKSINVTAMVKPTMNLQSKDYSVTYVLTEDGVTGYDQTNYYDEAYGKISVDELPEDLKFLATAGTTYKPTYNDVSRGIASINGIANSFTDIMLNEGNMYTHNYTIAVPSTVLNVDNLSVTAILIDNTTGEIVTAEKALVGEDAFATGLENVKVPTHANVEVVGSSIKVSGATGNVQVYNAAGELVQNVSVNGSVSLPMFGAAGTYIVRVVAADAITVKKVVF